MSANLDLVRSIFADLERGDFLTSADWAHPEIEFVIADGPTAGRWTGVEGMAESVRGGLDAWEESRVYADEYRELDDGRVLVLHRRGGRGKTSGLELEELQTRGATLFHIRHCKVTRLISYYDRDRALADLGLAPEAGA